MMNVTQSLYRRERGYSFKKQYDNAVRGLKCYTICDFGLNSPVFACKFCKVQNYQQMLALANEDGRIALQDINQRVHQRSLTGTQAHHNAIFDLAWMDNDFKLVSVSGDHTAILWDVGDSDFKEIGRFQGHTRSIKTVVFKPEDPAVFVTGARDGVIMVWDTRCSRGQMQIKPDNFITNAHSFPEGNSSASKSKRKKSSPASRASSITSLLFQDQNSLFSCGAGDGLIKVWDLRKNYCVYKGEPIARHTLRYPGNKVRTGFTNMVLDPGGIRLYANCMDDVIYCYNVSTYEDTPIASYTGHQNYTFYIKSSLSPDGQYLVSGSSDEQAYIWNVNGSREPLVHLVGHDAEVTCVAWCPVGQMKIVTCSDDAFHCVWQVGSDFADEDNNPELKGWAEIVNNPPPEPIIPPLLSEPEAPTSLQDRTPKAIRKWRLRVERTPDDALYSTTPTSSTPEQTRCATCTADKHAVTPCVYCQAKLDERRVREGTKRKLEMLEDSTENYVLLCGRRVLSPIKEGNEGDVRRGSMSARRLFGTGKNPLSDDSTVDEKMLVETQPIKRPCLTLLSSPTMNLPNHVLDGTSPHHCCQPNTRHKENVDWLTRLRKEKEHSEVHGQPQRRVGRSRSSEISRKVHVPEASSRSETLLHYFSVQPHLMKQHKQNLPTV